MRKIKEDGKGITLVALVVTIVVLLILAGISLSLILGNNGIIKKAGDAKENYTLAKDEEQQTLDDTTGWIEKNVGEIKTENLKVNDTYNRMVSTKVIDEYGNTLIIPECFKIKNDEDTTATHVNEGITIIDDAGNEFVWIPVVDVYTDTTRTNKKTINLGRYSFASDGSTIPNVADFYEEDSTQTDKLKNYGNTIATNINQFINSAKSNHGFYIGRYELRTNNERTAPSTITYSSEIGNQYVCNFITQNQAASLCKNMYTGKSFSSDLINSYAWDTAILFAETFGGNASYANSLSINTELAKKGTNNLDTSDKICNIFDLCSNCDEWTTETYKIQESCGTDRGGNFDYYECDKTSLRSFIKPSAADVNTTARAILII